MPTVNDVLTVARSWLGTKFEHQGRQKGIRCDCIGLIVEVCREVGLVTQVGLPATWNPTGYGRYPESYGPLQILTAYGTPVPTATMRAGDVALFRASTGQPAHLGFVGDKGQPWSLIHAYNAVTVQQARVQEHRLSAAWLRRLHRVYRLPLEEC